MQADELLETVRKECAPPVWSRAVSQARSGQLTGKRGSDGSLELRMGTKGGMISPQVTLDLEHGEWSCDCPSNEPVCVHVAAALIAFVQAEKEGRPLDGVQGPAATVSYELVETEGSLMLKRWLKRENSKDLLTARLIEERQKGERSQIATTRADVEIELLLGSLRDGPIPRAFVLKLFDWLHQVEEVTFADAPAKLGEPVHAITARVEKRGEGFRLSVGPNAALERIYKNGVAYVKGQLCPLRDVELSDTDLTALRAGRNFEPHELADLVGRVIPALRQRLPVQAPRELLEGAVAMKPRVVLQADVMNGVLEVLPTIVYGDPPSARVDEGRLTYLGGPVPLRDSDAEIALTRTVHTRLGLELGRRKRLEGEAALKLSERVRGLGAVAVSGGGMESFGMRGDLSPDLRIEGDGFDLSFQTTKGERASAEAVVAAWRHGSPLVALEGGGFAPLPNNFLAQHGHLVSALLAAKQEKELPKASRIDLGRLCEALEQPPPPDVAALRALGRDFAGIPDAPLPDGLHADLRDYQRAGYRWLRFLSNTDLGGLLADDMGLGKTLQTLCVL
ncbi:MAG: SNF2-related protein, partial [Polyangiales bacterium]